MFLSICCIYAAWVAKGFLLKFRQKGSWQESREAFNNNIVEENHTQRTGGIIRWPWWKICGTYLLHIKKGSTFLWILHLCRTQRMQYFIGIQTWNLCQNHMKNLILDSNAKVLSHEQNCKAQKLWSTFPWAELENIKALAPSWNFIPHEQTSQHNYTPWHQWHRHQQQASLPWGTAALGQEKRVSLKGMQCVTTDSNNLIESDNEEGHQRTNTKQGQKDTNQNPPSLSSTIMIVMKVSDSHVTSAIPGLSINNNGHEHDRGFWGESGLYGQGFLKIAHVLHTEVLSERFWLPLQQNDKRMCQFHEAYKHKRNPELVAWNAENSCKKHKQIFAAMWLRTCK